MGDPAVPTPAERKATLELARAIVEAVRNDEPMPFDEPDISAIRATVDAPLDIDVGRNILAREQMHAFLAWGETIADAVFRLAQDLCDTRRALDAACHMLDGEDVDPDGVHAAAFRRLEVGDE